MSFTTPSTDPASFNWRSAAIVNEIRAGIRERQAALGVALIPLAVAGDSAQSAAQNFAAMQDAIAALIPGFCDHTASGGDYSGMAAVPVWQISDDGADHYFFDAFPAPQVGWRRQVVKGTFIAGGGGAAAGDIIGTWLFEDLQNALKLLRWIPVALVWSTHGENNCKDASAIDDSVGAAKATAAAHYAAQSPFNNSNNGPSAGSYQEEHSNVPGGFIAKLLRRYAYIGNTTLPPLAASVDADFYFAAVKAIGYSSPVPADTFDANGDGVIESDPTTIGAKQKTITYDGSGTAWQIFGDAALAQPDWCTDPAIVGDFFSKGWCYEGQSTAIVHAADAFTWK